MGPALVMKVKVLPWETDCKKCECGDRLKLNLRTVTREHGPPWSARELGVMKLQASLIGLFQHQTLCLAWEGSRPLHSLAGEGNR